MKTTTSKASVSSCCKRYSCVWRRTCRSAVICPAVSIPVLSSAVLGQSAGPVKAFTIGFDDKDYDETPIAVEMAQSVGADQDVMRLKADHLYDNFAETLWHTERTIYNTLGVAKLLMSRHVNKAGYKVVVTGEGSDELFGGYPAFRRDMFLHGLDHLSTASERLAWEALLAESNKLFKGAMLAETESKMRALTARGRLYTHPVCSPGWPVADRQVPAPAAR